MPCNRLLADGHRDEGNGSGRAAPAPRERHRMTPLHLDLTNHALIADVSGWGLRA